jgi:hypothetical protein
MGPNLFGTGAQGPLKSFPPIPEIGYADDSLIVRTVLNRHDDIFRDYCRFRKIRWSKISFAPQGADHRAGILEAGSAKGHCQAKGRRPTVLTRCW